MKYRNLFLAAAAILPRNCAGFGPGGASDLVQLVTQTSAHNALEGP